MKYMYNYERYVQYERNVQYFINIVPQLNPRKCKKKEIGIKRKYSIGWLIMPDWEVV